jgi:hypothetical protein
MYQCHNCNAYITDNVAHEYQEKKRREQLPLIEKKYPREIGIEYGEGHINYKVNQILDILEENGLLRTK